MPLVKKWQLDEHEEDVDAHHRKWSWADEQSWDRAIVVPLQGRPATDGTDPSGGWDKSGDNPVLGLGASGKFDDKHVAFPCVLKVGNEYRVYYAGWNATRNKYSGIGLATTTNPFGTLTRYSADPIIPLGSAGAVDDDMVYSPSVIYDHVLEKYVMWYIGYDGAGNTYLCRATSTDGLSWTKDSPPNVYKLPRGNYPNVIKVGNFYHAVYHYGATKNLNLFHSNDGLSWDDYGEILAKGASGAWDDDFLNYAGIFWNLGVWYLMYMGNDGSNGRIGVAISNDGFNFTKFGANPVFSVGAGGAWDDVHIGCPSLLMVERTFYLWYQGYDGANWKIGVARMKL